METTVAVAGVKVVIIVIHPDHIFCNSTDLLLVCLQLHRFHWSLTSLIITRRWLLLTALPLSGMTISTSQFTADSTQHASMLPSCCLSLGPYKVIQLGRKLFQCCRHLFSCEGVLLVFFPPEEREQSWWVRIKWSRDILTKLFVETPAEVRAVCNSQSGSVWTLLSSPEWPDND